MRRYFYGKIFVVIMMSIIFVSCAEAAETSSILNEAPTLILQSKELTIRIVPSRAWTFDEIKFGAKSLTTQTSQSGLVLNFGGAQFLGSGHTEAGKEAVRSVELKVGGKIVNAQNGGVIKGESIEFIKESILATTRLKSVIRMKSGTLECEQFLTATQDTPINFLYAFMFPWNTRTTQWFAQTTSGRIREGDFNSANRAWELRDDVRWTSIYHPDAELAAITIFDPDSQNGAGVKHAYWNIHKAYHKEYYQPLAKTTLAKNRTYQWKVKVLFVPARETDWKETVQKSLR